MHSIYLTFVSFIAAGTLFGGCGGKTPARDSDSTAVVTDSLPADVTDIVDAVTKDDRERFSSRVNYPLERPYPLKDIKDQEEMKSYYQVMVDDSLKNVIAKSKGDDWSSEGWRGWTVKEGKYLWIDGEIYEVTYLSARERLMKDSLVAREKASLPPSLSKGWMPEWVMEDADEGTLYRIDADSLALAKLRDDEIADGGEYRLSIYRRGGDLKKEPERVLRGRRRMEGTVGSVSYYFDNHSPKELSDSAEYVIELYSEAGGPKLHRRRKRDHIDHDLKKVYWLDKVDQAVKDSIGK